MLSWKSLLCIISTSSLSVTYKHRFWLQWKWVVPKYGHNVSVHLLFSLKISKPCSPKSCICKWNLKKKQKTNNRKLHYSKWGFACWICHRLSPVPPLYCLTGWLKVWVIWNWWKLLGANRVSSVFLPETASENIVSIISKTFQSTYVFVPHFNDAIFRGTPSFPTEHTVDGSGQMGHRERIFSQTELSTVFVHFVVF